MDVSYRDSILFDYIKFLCYTTKKGVVENRFCIDFFNRTDL